MNSTVSQITLRTFQDSPEKVAFNVVGPMRVFLAVFWPVVWFFSHLTNAVFKRLGLPTRRDDGITSDDIGAMAEAGAEAGVLAAC